MLAAAIYSVQRVAVTSPLPPVPFPPERPRVNVYLCIKQALFIRPMNMHCLVAVARCRVQTRRYHCLINHIQSHRLTLWPHFPFSFYPRSPFTALITPLAERTRRVIPQGSPGVLPHRVIPLAPPLAPLRGPLFRCSPLANWPQLTLIYVIFSGRPHVTTLQRTLNQACPMPVRSARGCGCNGRRVQKEGSE